MSPKKKAAPKRARSKKAAPKKAASKRKAPSASNASNAEAKAALDRVLKAADAAADTLQAQQAPLGAVRHLRNAIVAERERL